MKWIWIIGGSLLVLVAAVALIGAMLPQNHRATRRATYRQKPVALFEVISGPANWRSYITSTGTLPDGKWWELDAHNNKITYELVSDNAPFHRVIRISDKSLPYGGTWTFDLTPTPEGTTLRITEDGEVYNVIFRFLSHFFFGQTATMETYLTDLGKKFGETVRVEP